MRKSFAAMLCGLLAAVATAAPVQADGRLEKILAEGKITNACEPYFAPMEFIDNTKTGQAQFRGSDIELARYIAQKLGVELEVVPLTWSAVLAGVTMGKYDMAITGLAYTEERAKNMNLSDVYKPGAEQGLLVRRADADKYTSLADFAGRRVGFQSGTLQEQLCGAQLKNSHFQTYDTVQNAVLALDAGKIDAVAVSVPNGEMFVAAHPALTVTPARFALGKSGNCVAVPRGETELRERINEILAEVRELGLYEQWTKQAIAEASALGLK